MSQSLSLLCLVERTSIFNVPSHPLGWFVGEWSGYLPLWVRRYLGFKHSVYRCSTNDPFLPASVSLTLLMVPFASNSRLFHGSVGQIGLLLSDLLLGQRLSYNPLNSATEITSTSVFSLLQYISLTTALISWFFVFFVFVLVGLCFFLFLYYYFHGIVGRKAIYV